MTFRFLPRFSVLGALALLATFAPEADAQERPQAQRRDSISRRLEPVVVRGIRIPAVIGGAGAVVATVDSLRLPAAPLLEEALRAMPFILVHRNSRGEMEISVRGSDSRQTAILLDGVPLSLGWDNRSDVSLVPITGATSIRLVRGLSSLLHGPNVLGGVVEVSLANALDGSVAPTSLTLASTVDQFGGHAFQAAGGGAVGNGFSARAGAGYRDRPGLARAGGVVEPGPDPDLRTNSAAHEVDAFGALGWRGDNGARLGLSATTYKADRGVPPELHVEDPRYWRYPDASRTLVALSGRTATGTTPFGTGAVEASVGANFGRTRIDSYKTAAFTDIKGREAGDERVLTARVAADHSLGSRATLRAAAVGAVVNYDETLDADPVNKYEQRLWSLASEANWSPIPSTQFSGGVALDAADTPEAGGKQATGRMSAWGGRVGVTHVTSGEAVRLHAALSRRSRFPALRELYSGALGRFDPNPNLRPEQLTAVEGGATTVLGPVELQAVVFHHQLKDAVVKVATEGRKQRRVNRDELRSTGTELLAAWRHPSGVELMGDLLLQRVRISDPTADASDRPENMPQIRGGAELGVPLPWSVRGLAGVNYLGDQYCLNPNKGPDLHLGANMQGDIGLERDWSLGRAASAVLSTLRTRLSADNFTNQATYDQCGLPQPGRTVRLTVMVH